MAYNTNHYGAEMLSEKIYFNNIAANQINAFYLLTEHDITSFEYGMGLGLLPPSRARYFNLETKAQYTDNLGALSE